MIAIATLSLLVAMTTAMDPTPDTSYITIDFVKDLIKSVEDDQQDLLNGISTVSTLCEVGWERIHRLNTGGLGAVNSVDSQQEALIALFRDTIKEMQHRKDDAQGSVDGTDNLAGATQGALGVLGDQVSGIAGKNDEQDGTIADLGSRIASYKDTVLAQIEGTGEYLGARLYDVQEKVGLIRDRVNKRKCEYGFLGIDLQGYSAEQRVDFTTEFHVAPTMAMSLVGFAANLDVVKYGQDQELDQLNLDKYVDELKIDESGFTVVALDSSSGKVAVKTVYCRWMACQYLDQPLDLGEHPDE